MSSFIPALHRRLNTAVPTTVPLIYYAPPEYDNRQRSSPFFPEKNQRKKGGKKNETGNKGTTTAAAHREISGAPISLSRYYYVRFTLCRSCIINNTRARCK